MPRDPVDTLGCVLKPTDNRRTFRHFQSAPIPRARARDRALPFRATDCIPRTAMDREEDDRVVAERDPLRNFPRKTRGSYLLMTRRH